MIAFTDLFKAHPEWRVRVVAAFPGDEGGGEAGGNSQNQAALLCAKDKQHHAFHTQHERKLQPGEPGDEPERDQQQARAERDRIGAGVEFDPPLNAGDQVTELNDEGIDTLRINRSVNLNPGPFTEIENAVLTGGYTTAEPRRRSPSSLARSIHFRRSATWTRRSRTSRSTARSTPTRSSRRTTRTRCASCARSTRRA